MAGSSLESYFSPIPVTDATRRSVTGGRATVDLSNPERVAVMLRPLTPFAFIWVSYRRRPPYSVNRSSG